MKENQLVRDLKSLGVNGRLSYEGSAGAMEIEVYLGLRKKFKNRPANNIIIDCKDMSEKNIFMALNAGNNDLIQLTSNQDETELSPVTGPNYSIFSESLERAEKLKNK